MQTGLSLVRTEPRGLRSGSREAQTAGLRWAEAQSRLVGRGCVVLIRSAGRRLRAYVSSAPESARLTRQSPAAHKDRGLVSRDVSGKSTRPPASGRVTAAASSAPGVFGGTLPRDGPSGAGVQSEFRRLAPCERRQRRAPGSLEGPVSAGVGEAGRRRAAGSG